MQLFLVFLGGLMVGAGVMAALMLYWPTENAPGRHSYPRKTARPPVQTRVPGRPTNINEPPSVVRQVQFRARKETRE